MCELPEIRESIDPTTTLGVDASWVGAGFSESLLFPARLDGLVLRGDRGESIESDALSVIASGSRWRCPFGLPELHSSNSPMLFS